jgi:EpsI family protein
MTTSRLILLLAVLLGGLSTVFLVPKQVDSMPVGIDPHLPETLGEWWGHDVAVSQKEREVLGPDTEFSRKEYTNGRGDSILVSIVLAGHDMMTSIHRPERCLDAQGWQFTPGDDRTIEIPGAGNLPVMRLKNHRIERLPDGGQLSLENICYYWFAGYRDLTESHLQRVYIDSRDRLVARKVQRWAMIMISSNITAPRLKFGRDEKAADELLQDFIRQLSPKLHLETVQFH